MISVMTAARMRMATARRTDPRPARLRAPRMAKGGRISGRRINHQGLPTVSERFPSIVALSSLGRGGKIHHKDTNAQRRKFLFKNPLLSSLCLCAFVVNLQSSETEPLDAVIV